MPNPTDLDPTTLGTVEIEPRIKDSEYFSDRLNCVLERPLTPKNISNYAYGALSDLITLIHEVVDTHYGKSETSPVYDHDTEETALTQYGLGSVESMLDYLTDMNNDIGRLDTVLDNAEILDQNILPTGVGIRFAERTVALSAPEKSNEIENEIIERAKTALFVLEKEFNINVQPDSTECHTSRAPAHKNNKRRVDFFVIQVPNLERTILICDGKNQSTFIFNNEVIEQSDQDLDGILACDKLEIKRRLNEKPELGKWIKYSDDFFVSSLISAIHSPRNDFHEKAEKMSFLVPKASEDEMSEKAFRSALGGIAPGPLRDAVLVLRKELGDIMDMDIKSFSNNPSCAFKPEQRHIIEEYLIKHNTICPMIPETYRFAKDLAAEWGIGYESITAAAKVLVVENSEFGELEYFRRPRAKAWPGYSPSQILKIHKYLEEKKMFYPRATENDHSVHGIADRFSKKESQIKRAIASLGDSIGPTDEKMHHSKVTTNYNLEQALLIVAETDRQEQEKKITKGLAVTALKS